MPALPPDQTPSSAAAGDGAERTTVEARGGARNRYMLPLLGVSLLLVIVAMFGVWALRSGDLSKPGAHGSQKSADVSSFTAPEPSPKQAPPGMPSTTGQTTPDASNNTAGR